MQDELPLVLDDLKNHLDIVNLGLLLMFVTGVRVGELVAIKSCDVDGNVIHICRTESHYKDAETGKDMYVIKDTPKTAAGIRNVIVPTDYSWVIRKIQQMNPFGEFLFMRDGSRIRAYTVRLRLHRVCKKVEVHDKSTHKARKTYASILLSSGVDTSTVISPMGHTDISCTEQYYHRNRKDIAAKTEVFLKHCRKAFVANRKGNEFCSQKCKNQYNVYKSYDVESVIFFSSRGCCKSR